MTAILWILVGLVAIDVIAHFQHITLLSELKNDLAMIKSAVDRRSP